MNISLELTKETVEKVAREASRVGQDVPAFLADFVERSFSGEKSSRRSLAEILAPFRAEIEQSGITDDQLDALFTEVRKSESASRSRT